MYVKIFAQIYDSSIAEDYLVRLVFEDFLVLADKDGHVDMTAAAIARRTNVPIEIVSRAIEKLSAPDPESRSPDEEGRRIVLLDSHRTWGWRIVNYAHYRSIRDDDARKEYFRDRKREQRAKGKDVLDSHGQSNTVSDCPSMSPKQEARSNKEKNKERSFLARSVPPEELAGTLPLVDGSSYAISKSQVAEWSQAYPGIDVATELRKFKSWSDANPTRKKTRKGIARAVVGWLSRAQDRAPGNGGNGIAAGSRNPNVEALRQSLAADQDGLDSNGDVQGGEAGRRYAYPLLETTRTRTS